MIYRCQPRPTPYQIISKVMLDDDRLSPQALGVMTYLVGRPPNWEVTIVQLAKHFKQSKASIGTILKELARFGYTRLVTIRNSGTTKFCGKRWEVFELPDLNPDFKNQTKTTIVMRAEDSLYRRPKKTDIGKNRPSEKPVIISKEQKINKDPILKNNECVNEHVEGITHTHFFRNERVFNENNTCSPQNSATPFSRADESASKKILFRESIYGVQPDGVKKLRDDLIIRHPRYEQAHTLYYHKRLLNWSDSEQRRCNDWVAKAASFIDGDEGKGELRRK